MSDNGQQPPVAGQPVQIPVVVLANISMRVDTMPDGTKMLMLGPVALAIPFGPENIDWLNQQFAGSNIVIAKPGDLL
jgi:hypothetical protein